MRRVVPVQPLPLGHDGVAGVAGRLLPASKIPNRVHTDPASRHPPAAADRIRRARPTAGTPPTAARVAPTPVRALAALSSVPGRPSCSGSAVTPMPASMVRLAIRSAAAPATAIRRAGAASSVGDRRSPAPPAAAAALPTKTKGRSRRAACQVGVAVSAISTAV